VGFATGIAAVGGHSTELSIRVARRRRMPVYRAMGVSNPQTLLRVGRLFQAERRSDHSALSLQTLATNSASMSMLPASLKVPRTSRSFHSEIVSVASRRSPEFVPCLSLGGR